MASLVKAGRKTGTASVNNSKKLKLKGTALGENSKKSPKEGSQKPKVVTQKVRAIALGYYGAQLREEGDVFELRDEAHFSSSWMEKA